MIIQLHQITDTGNLFKFTLDRKSFTRLDNRFIFKLISCMATLKQNAGQVHLRGRFQLFFETACDLCLAPVKLNLDREFELKLVPDQGFSPEKSTGNFEFSPHGVDTESFNGHEIDLTTIFEDQVLLELPLSFRCEKNCAGVCSSCGANLNQNGCGCETNKKNSPFAILRQLRS